MTITLEVDGRRIEVDDAFTSMTPEQQQQTIDEIASGLPPRENTAMGFVNRGIANTLGGPVDFVTAGLNKIPGVDIQDPLGGSESIKSAMGMVNADVARGDPQTFGQHVANGVGEGAGALLPVVGATRALSAAKGTTGLVAAEMNAPFVSQPIRATSAELAAGGGARAAGYGADQMSEGGDAGPVARTVAELTGGLAAAAGPGAVMRGTSQVAQAMPVTGTAVRGVKAAVAPFTDAGGRVRAENRVQSLVTDPQATAQAMMQENPGNLTPAQMTRDPNLLALERTVAEQNPSIRDDLAARASKSTTTLREDFLSVGGEGLPKNAVEYLTRRRDDFRTRLNGFKDAAQQRAEERVQRLDPARRDSENSLIVREEIDRAYERAAQQENALWNAVPREAQVPTQNARTVFAQVNADTPRARAADIPTEASSLLGDGGFGDVETVREMHGLYSQLRQVSREAMGGATPNENKARIANELADAILVDLGATGGMPSAVGTKINEARTFSREMNEVFNQGTVGNITARTRAGGDAMAPETALTRTVAPGGPRGAVAVDDIRRATGNGSDSALQDFLRARLMDRANGRGPYNPAQADAFQRANSETLSRFPELQGDISAANNATRASQARNERVDGIVARLDNPRQNAGAALLNAAPGDEIAQAVFKARDPISAARSLRRETTKDPSGRALDGIRRGTLDFLTGRASGRFAADGTQNISGNNLFGDLQNSQHRAVLATLFEPAEIQRMERIARQFQGLEGARSAGSLDAVIDDTPNQIIGFVASTFAARQGAKAGHGVSGASLLTANFASKRMRDLLGSLTNDRAERLIQDAITDRDLFVSLMTRNTDTQGMRQAERRLAEWMVSTYGLAVPDEEEGQPSALSILMQQRRGALSGLPDGAANNQATLTNSRDAIVRALQQRGGVSERPNANRRRVALALARAK